VPRARHLHEAQDRSSGLVVIPRRHTINLEDPDLFNRALLDFLTAVDAGRWPLPQPAVADRIRHHARRRIAMTLPLEPYTVIDLTRARSGPTACASSRTWARAWYRSRRARAPPPCAPTWRATSRGAASTRRTSTATSARSTLDLKSPRGIEIIHKLGQDCGCRRGNFRPDVKTRLGIDYETLSASTRGWSTAASPASARTALSRPAGLRPDRPGHGRAHVDHRLPGQGPVRVASRWPT